MSKERGSLGVYFWWRAGNPDLWLIANPAGFSSVQDLSQNGQQQRTAGKGEDDQNGDIQRYAFQMILELLLLLFLPFQFGIPLLEQKL